MNLFYVESLLYKIRIGMTYKILRILLIIYVRIRVGRMIIHF